VDRKLLGCNVTPDYTKKPHFALQKIRLSPNPGAAIHDADGAIHDADGIESVREPA
jgi:hypothetical protein